MARRHSEGEEEVETASLEDMMGNDFKAAWCRDVKQCLLEDAAKLKVTKK